jgi:hypothetical protein
VKNVKIVAALAAVIVVAAVAAGSAAAAAPKGWAACMASHGVSFDHGVPSLTTAQAALAACGVPAADARHEAFVSCLREHGIDLGLGAAAAGTGLGTGKLYRALRDCSSDVDRIATRLTRFRTCMADHGIVIPTDRGGLLSLGLQLLGNKAKAKAAWSACHGQIGSMSLPGTLRGS